MNEYDEEILHYFLEHQTQLFPEAVAESPEEAEEFLEDCMAVVCKKCGIILMTRGWMSPE